MTILENGRLKIIFYVVGVHKYLYGYIFKIKIIKFFMYLIIRN